MAHHHHQHQHPGATETDSAAMTALLDLDAEVLHSYLAEVTEWVYELAGDPPARRILDVGAGTGTGALAMARRFERADVIAVDLSAQLLDRLMVKARELGVAERIHIVQADLDAAWPDIDTVDLVWASSSLHHMTDPDRVLTDILGTIRPGGLLALAELDSFPRFLPDDIGIGRPGLEARCHALMAEARAVDVPELGSDWAARLAKAGFTVEAERHFVIDLTSPLPAAAGSYAQESLRRMRSGLTDRIDADDLATLDVLVGDGPDSVLHRDDLAIHAERTLWAARRP